MSNIAPTLFDFDDFFPEADHKAGPAGNKKNKTVKTQKPDSVAPSDESPEGAEHTAAPGGTEPVQTADSQPGIIGEGAQPPAGLPGHQELADTITGAAKDNLDEQLLQELAVSAALTISKYPFDPSGVEFIPPEKKRKPGGPEAKRPAAPGTKGPAEEEGTGSAVLPDWNLDKNYYSIGEVAGMFGVNISHIRFWTTEFNMKPRTTRKGDRLYTPGQIASLRLIYHLVKEKKYTLKGAREILKSRKATVEKNLDLKESLIQLQEILQEVRAGL